MADRRTFISTLAAGSIAMLYPKPGFSGNRDIGTDFRFCLNTSTISGQKPGLEGYIGIASKAGYDGVELWVRDVKKYLESGNSAQSLKRRIENQGLTVEGAIGFAPWLKSKEGMAQMRSDMEMMASIGCKRMAAPASGYQEGEILDYRYAGEKFHELLEIGSDIGIQPCLEFWGASPVLNQMGQVLMIAANADHPDVKILADVYHMFRGGSGFNSLKMLNGNILELFHMNDYMDTIPREQQKDSDRVYPGEGVAPFRQILTDLKQMGGKKVLSLELFNPVYWEQDAVVVAATGLAKMKKLVDDI